MAKTRLRIGLQLEESIVPGSIIRTDAANEQEYIAPGTEQQVLTIVAGIPTWASESTLSTATDCVVDTAKIIIDEAGTKKTATIRQIANSTKIVASTGLSVTDQTHIHSTGGTIILPDALCQEVTVTTTPCDPAQTIIDPAGTTKIDGFDTLAIPQDGWRSYKFIWDATYSRYRITSSYFKEALTSIVIPVTNATTQSVQLDQFNSNTYDINWGDGNTTLGVVNDVGASHTYATAFTGNITLTSICVVEPERLIFTPNSFTSENIRTLPTGLTHYQNEGNNNTTTGNISTLPVGLTYYNNRGVNTTFGDISTLPTGLTIYRNEGANTTTGNISTLPTGLTYYQNIGSNTTSGNISTLPTGLTLYSNAGSNTTTGNISTLPTGLILYNNLGVNTTTGDISTLPTGLTSYTNTGSNTTSGNISTLPAGLIVYTNGGTNTTTGDISTLPTGLTSYINTGGNTTSGDISTLPTGLTFYQNIGNNQVNQYTSGRTWATNMRRFTHSPAAGFGLTSVMVDNLLIDLAATTWVTGSFITIAGNNAARTAASNAAVLTLQGLGVTVITN